MKKLVYMFRHVKPIGISIPGYGGFTPLNAVVDMGIEPIPGRKLEGVVYKYDYIHKIDLKPEEPDPLPESIEHDPDLLREFKLSQARQIAENIKQNEQTIRWVKHYEAEGCIEAIGRAYVDENGNIIPKKDLKAPKEEPKVEEKVQDEPEVIEVAQAPRRGRKPKEEPKDETA